MSVVIHVPAEMKAVPSSYRKPSLHAGRLEKLEYETWDSLTYEKHEKKITKTAWIYLPYGYSEKNQYNIVYMSHGGWSNETTLLGTADDPHPLKLYIDHAMENGEMAPLIIVALTYNNRSDHDSWDYDLAIRLTDNYHRELVNDLMPAVETKYRTYSNGVTKQDFLQSRDHRGFAGFSMGSVNTWRTFQYCLDYFHYFMPMSGNLTSDGEAMAAIVRYSKWNWNDFFILSSSGTDDFARPAFVEQIINMSEVSDRTFRYDNNEQEGNLFYREWPHGTHGAEACDQYTWNNLIWISRWMEQRP